MTPFETAWLFLKSDDADYNLFADKNLPAGFYSPENDTVNLNLAQIQPIGRNMGFADEDIDKYAANLLARLNAHEFTHAASDGQPGIGDMKSYEYGQYSRDLPATARIEHPANIMEYPESSIVAHKQLARDLFNHRLKNATDQERWKVALGGRLMEDYPMRGITNIIQQLQMGGMTPQQKEKRFREIMGVRARNPMLRHDRGFRTPKQWDNSIRRERMKDKKRSR